MIMTVSTLNSTYQFRHEVVLRNGVYFGMLVQGTGVDIVTPFGQDYMVARFRVDTNLPHDSFIQGDGTVRTSIVRGVTYGA